MPCHGIKTNHCALTDPLERGERYPLYDEMKGEEDSLSNVLLTTSIFLVFRTLLLKTSAKCSHSGH